MLLMSGKSGTWKSGIWGSGSSVSFGAAWWFASWGVFEVVFVFPLEDVFAESLGVAAYDGHVLQLALLCVGQERRIGRRIGEQERDFGGNLVLREIHRTRFAIA